MTGRSVGGSIIEGIVKALLIAAVLYATYHYAAMAYEYGYQIYNQTAMEEGDGRSVHVTIPDGASVSEIGSILKRAGLIEDVRLFTLQERLGAYHGKLQAGEYDLTTAMVPDEMMALMSKKEEDVTETSAQSAPVSEETAEEETAKEETAKEETAEEETP